MTQNRRDFIQFCKYFTIRAVEIIVQSRLGGKIRTECRGNHLRDWFNINIDDVPEIAKQLYKCLNGIFLPTLPEVNVLVSLRTTDGDTLHLEVWKLRIDIQKPVENVSVVRLQLYHRLGVLLRSILAASRVTPTYKLYSRNQSAETYVLCYQIYAFPADHSDLLGENYRTVELGSVGCVLGSIRVTLYYRTKMVISTDNATKQMMKNVDEHYYESTSKDEQSAETDWAVRERDSLISDGVRNFGNRVEIGEQLIMLNIKNSRCGGAVREVERFRDVRDFAQPFAIDLLPDLPPLIVPSPQKNAAIYISSTGPNFSPCFSNFSISPGSLDFSPLSPMLNRRASVTSPVTFNLGAASGSSSEEGYGSPSYLTHGPSSTSLVPFKPSSAAVLFTTESAKDQRRPQRNCSAGGVFFMEISGHASSSSSSSATKASTAHNEIDRRAPDDVIASGGGDDDVASDATRRTKSATFKVAVVDSFPFSRLLSAAARSAPILDFNVAQGAKTSSSSESLARSNYVSATFGAAPLIEDDDDGGEAAKTLNARNATRANGVSVSSVPNPARCTDTMPLSITMQQRDIKRAAADRDRNETFVMTSSSLPYSPQFHASDHTIALTATESSSIIRRRVISEGSFKPITDDHGGGGLTISSSSSDDSFVHVKMRPAFAFYREAALRSSPSLSVDPSSTLASGDVALDDASDLLSQFKAAPPVLQSFFPTAAKQCESVTTAAKSASGNTSMNPLPCLDVAEDEEETWAATIPSQLKEFEKQAKTFDNFLNNLKANGDGCEDGEDDEI